MREPRTVIHKTRYRNKDNMIERYGHKCWSHTDMHLIGSLIVQPQALRLLDKSLKLPGLYFFSFKMGKIIITIFEVISVLYNPMR